MRKKAHNHLLRIGDDYCPILSQIVSNNGMISINADKTIHIFECLAKTVVEQQLSYKAAKNIWGKVKISSEKKGLKLIDYFDEKNKSSLRNDGLSQNKIKSILGAKDAVNDGSISLQKLEVLPYDDDDEDCDAAVVVDDDDDDADYVDDDAADADDDACADYDDDDDKKEEAA